MDDYPRFHKDRVNLVLHALAVPLFVVGAVAALVFLGAARWTQAGACIGGVLVSIAVQGLGHQREPNPPIPFAGPADFAKRILAEQFYRFPRFAIGGGWLRAWRGDAS